MRRRRHRLEVSTFPFLAVLLCAMGSLILLLLVLDRRAKVVAHAKALQTVRARQEERETARHAAEERERVRQERRQQSASRRDDLRSRAGELVQKQSATAKEADEERGRAAALARLLLGEREELERTEKEIVVGRAGTGKLRQMGAAARAEVNRVTTQLRGLEDALVALKAARQRDARTFSVVPYKGRRGDNRRPLYLECTANGLVFHPDRLSVRGPGLSGDVVRQEVERRTARQREIVLASGGKPDPHPYLMMLVRPDGISLYYEALAALKGMEIDFGYEFVDVSWLLDFPESDEAAPAQPWMKAEKLVVEPGGPSAPTRKVSGLSPGDGVTHARATRGGEGALPPLQGEVAPEAGITRGSPSSSRPSGVSGAGTSSGGTGEGGPGATGTESGTAAARGGVENVDGRMPGTAAPPGGTAPASSGSGGGLPPLPWEKAAGEASPRGSAGAATGNGERPAQGGGSGEGEPGDPAEGGAPGLAPLPGEKRRESAAPRRVRYLGNRDWVIPIECLADGVVLKPAGQKFPLASLANPPGSESPLLQAVRQTIARRQAGVRPGEPPYRPQVRFLLRPDALRTYHLAYPALEPLGIPLTRQNVETP